MKYPDEFGFIFYYVVIKKCSYICLFVLCVSVYCVHVCIVCICVLHVCVYLCIVCIYVLCVSVSVYLCIVCIYVFVCNPRFLVFPPANPNNFHIANVFLSMQVYNNDAVVEGGSVVG